MKIQLSEVQITPVKPKNGLVGFASVVLYNSLYLGNIGIYTRPAGGYRLTYPTRKSYDGQLHIFHPINRSTSECLERAISEKFEEVMNTLIISNQHETNNE